MEAIWIEDLKTSVWALSYDFPARSGIVTMPPENCADMSGTIRFFERIDPGVEHILTLAHSHKDTRYDRMGSKWVASCPSILAEA